MNPFFASFLSHNHSLLVGGLFPYRIAFMHRIYNRAETITTNRYTIRAGSFVVCTSSAGTTITNTATLTPQSSTGNGSPLTATAAITLQIFGCELPPDVNFQDIQTWGAQTFSWQLTKTATRNAFSVDQNAGSLAVEYTLKATATPTTGSWAVSGAVFVNNVHPGILNIARLQVQLSTGQTAIPTCSLTTAYTSSDGMVWGGANAGGSITTAPFSSTGLPIVTTDTAAALAIGAMGIGTGIFNQFILPEFASATCRFNISLGATNPGSTVTIIPQMNWGFGGMYMLNQPSQLILNFNPPDQFFPVGGCVSLTDVAQAGALQIANGGPNNQQLCVEGRSAPFTQPGAITYAVTATINPTTTSDCTPGGTKTYTVRCRPCLPPACLPCFACCTGRFAALTRAKLVCGVRDVLAAAPCCAALEEMRLLPSHPYKRQLTQLPFVLQTTDLQHGDRDAHRRQRRHRVGDAAGHDHRQLRAPRHDGGHAAGDHR